MKTNNNAGVIDFRPVFDFYKTNADFQAKTKKKSKIGVYQFDHETFVVFDRSKKREICVCSNYDDWTDAKDRAKNIAKLLNGSNEKTLG